MIVPELQPDLSGPTFPYDVLANEKIYPHPYSTGRSVREDLLAAVSRYADVRDCLLPETRLSAEPDLRRFDWAGVRGNENRNICLYRVFSSLGTPERAIQWMETQGFEATGPTILKGRNEQEIMVDGGYRPTKDGVLLPGGSFLDRWVIQKLVYAEYISATWSKDGRLLRAGFSSNTL